MQRPGADLALASISGFVSVPRAMIAAMLGIFIGSEAVARGELKKSEVRRHRAVFRDVYVPRTHELSLRDRTIAAWLWSRRRAIVAGAAASALHGANWVDADALIELIAPNARPQTGILVRNETLDDDEITRVGRLPVTTPARTAYDLGRYLPRGRAIARLDALMTPLRFRPRMSCSWPNVTRVPAGFGG